MRWRILAILFVSRIGIGLQFQTVASVGDGLIAAFGFDYVVIGLLIGLFMMPGLVLAIPAGYWGRFFSDRIMVVFGLGALALGGGVSSMANDTWVIGAGRLCAGVGFLLTNLYFTKMVADWFEGREIATAMSILVMSWPFGIAMGQIGHAWVLHLFGWQAPFQVASAYCLFSAIAIFLTYRPPHDLPPVSAGVAATLTGYEWRLIVIAGSAWGVFNAAYVTFLSFGPKALEQLGHTAIAAAGVISVGSWLMILSGAVCGQIVDRVGRRTLVLTLCMAGAIVSLILLGVPGAGLGASLLFGLVGMAPAGVIMAMSGQAMRPQVRAFGMGVFFTIYYAIMLIMPPISGALLDATGTELAPLWLGIVLFALVVPLAILFQHIKSQSNKVVDTRV